jgi:hypothetical protein
MAKTEVEPSLMEVKRKAIFLALVKAQDAGDTVFQSRRTVAKRFNISDGLVLRIESEGIEANWPPLE